MGEPRNPHEASASATGYLFQCRYALLAGLRAIPASPQLSISIEKFDDVAFEANGEPTDLIQTKHHIGKTGDLTDSSADLWKTLWIWLKRVAEDVEAPFRTRFVLLTTGSAPDGSAASTLRIRDRDETLADKRLLAAAAGSKNKDPAAATPPISCSPSPSGSACCVRSLSWTALPTSSMSARKSPASFTMRHPAIRSTTWSNASKAGGSAL